MTTQDPETLIQLAARAESRKDHVGAEKYYRLALQVKPGNWQLWFNLGVQLNLQQKAVASGSCMRRVIKLKPDYAPAHNFLANALRASGDIPAAEQHFAEAIRLDPQGCDAHYNYAQTHRYTANDPHLEILEALYREGVEREAGQRARLGFALASAYDQLQQYDEAFKYLNEANANWRSTLNYRKQRTSRLFASILANFPDAPPGISRESGPSGPTPIFIVGMPRSGTSLLEQMLGRHSRIQAAGELTILGRLCRGVAGGFPLGFHNMDSGLLTELGNQYREQLADWGDDFVIDKMPQNFLYLWIIRAALPEARVIHCRREPMDTCLSIYQRLFSRGHEYAYELGELAEYYQHYQRLMAHWEKQFGAFVLNTNYENLVQQPTQVLAHIFDHCDLDFEPDCTDASTAGGVVTSASASQVRQPLHSRSVERWRNYQKHLILLETALRKSELPTGEEG